MNEELPRWVPVVLSEPRFSPYLRAADGDVEAALALYAWNLDASAAFLIPLHWTETAVRNAMHCRLRAMFGRPDWWTTAPLDHNGQSKIQDARATLLRRGKDSHNPDSIVAELTLGFWVSLLGGHRVMHHEPIHHRHLEADHATLCRLIGQLSKEARASASAHDRVPEVLARRVRT